MSEPIMPQNITYNSHIQLVTVGSNKYIDKRFRLPLSRSDAEELRQKVILQRRSLEEAGVPTSELINIEVEPARAGGSDEDGFILYIRERFAGLDFMDVVNNDNYGMYLDRLLSDILRPFLKWVEDDYAKAGLDAIPRNFVYDNARGQFCYVDFIPPKVFYKGSYTQEIPECTDPDFFEVRMFSHNYLPGIIYVLYINLIREFPGQLGLTAGRIEQFLVKYKRSEAYREISGSPLYRVHSPSQVKEIIENLADWKKSHYFLLREAANWLNNYSPELEILKKEIYKVTSQERDPHSPDYGRIKQENFEKAKELIISACQNL